MQKRGWLLALLLILQVVSAQEFISRDAIPKDIPTTEVVATLAKPAVVQINEIMDVSAQVPGLAFENGKVVEIGPPSKSLLVRESKGSGFVVTPDGYIVTNAHVITPTQEELIDGFLKTTFDTRKVPEPLREPFAEYLKNKLVLTIQPRIVSVLQPISGPTGFILARIPAEVKKVGKATPGKDVAILKVSIKNMPTVSLTTDSPPTGSNIIVIGFPGAAEMGAAPNEATVTSGIISAYKMTEAGWKAIQIDADISPGSSGGPAFDKTGKVIGIATFGTTSAAAGYNWLVPTDIVMEFLNELNVKPARGVLDQVYEQGLLDYWNGKYQTAINEFHMGLELMPGHPLIPDFIFKSRLELEKAGYSTTKWKTAFFIFGAAVLIALIFLFLFFWREEKEIKELEKMRKR